MKILGRNVTFLLAGLVFFALGASGAGMARPLLCGLGVGAVLLWFLFPRSL